MTHEPHSPDCLGWQEWGMDESQCNCPAPLIEERDTRNAYAGAAILLVLVIGLVLLAAALAPIVSIYDRELSPTAHRVRP